MKIYLAAKFETRDAMRAHADTLWRLGFEVVSSWLHETAKSTYLDSTEFRRKLAMKDLQEVKAADLLLIDTSEISEGKSVELGFALAQNQGKLIIAVGPVRSIFHELADRHFDDWPSALAFLEESGWGQAHSKEK